MVRVIEFKIYQNKRGNDSTIILHKLFNEQYQFLCLKFHVCLDPQSTKQSR